MYQNYPSMKSLISFRYNLDLIRDLSTRFNKNRSATIAYCVSKTYSEEFGTPLTDLERDIPEPLMEECEIELDDAAIQTEAEKIYRELKKPKPD